LDLDKKKLNNIYNAIESVEWYFTDTRDGIQNPFHSPSVQNQIKVISLLEYYLKAIN